MLLSDSALLKQQMSEAIKVSKVILKWKDVFLFQKRAKDGRLSLFGGKADTEDIDEFQTLLRELDEELENTFDPKKFTFIETKPDTFEWNGETVTHIITYFEYILTDAEKHALAIKDTIETEAIVELTHEDIKTNVTQARYVDYLKNRLGRLGVLGV